VIQDFADSDTEKVWNREPSSALPQQLWRQAWENHNILDPAEVLQDANVPPGNRLECRRQT
jgi:proteic killer suppression protein